ncbi:Hpt domain-containing protein [Pseudoduganella sp. UC29_106]|uniref:Hpt domain-containing protein n=1 Tax=Pseudoduganella sp. UC29_106 TaxID=3374553 RepID=UPI003757FDAA
MATGPVDPAFQDRLQALRDKYAASIPERLQAVADALALCRGAIGSEQHIEQLHHALHSIAGSAGSFGFKPLGDDARRVEQQVRALMGKERSWEGIEQEVEQLLQLSYKQFSLRPHG